MRQLTFIAPGAFEWWDVPAPTLAADTDAIVRPLAVARCDLDLYLATGVVPRPGPYAFGHESIGEIVEAGAAVPHRPGDRVIVPFQLSCGRCDRCRRGWTHACERYPLGAAYGLKPTSGHEYGGALSDLMHIPFADHMLIPLPAGLEPATVASACDNIADGWRGVGPPLAERPGATVLVLGGLAQSVGLYAAGCAATLGAGRVLYLDDDAGRRARAQALGAEAAPFPPEPPGLFDIVVEATGTEAALQFAVRATGIMGVLTSVSIHFDPTTALPLTVAYMRGLRFSTSRVASRAALPHVLACLDGGFDPTPVTHRVVSRLEAPDAMTDPGPKLVFV